MTFRYRRWAVGGAALLAALAVVTASAPGERTRPEAGPPPAVAPRIPPSQGPAEPVPALRVRPAPADLAVIGYGPAPRGFPADPAPLSTAPLTEGLRLLARVPAYDAPGGRPRAYLPPGIAGVTLTVPVVARDAGWTGVLLPSTNRRIGWLPPQRPGTWATVALRDQLVVERRAHRLTWRRDGRTVRSWPVTLGTAVSPTPLGRTFILGRSRLPGEVYAGTDVFALAAVPDDPGSVPYGLRGAHIGIHTWYNDWTLGRDATDGCIRLTRAGQRELLAHVPPGTPVVVVPGR